MSALCGCASPDYATNVRPARRLLKSLSIKQGRKYDDPESARDIPTFIEFHRLDVDEILDPIESFSMYPSCHLSALV
jgi:phosphatidylserine decarboxylase